MSDKLSRKTITRFEEEDDTLDVDDKVIQCYYFNFVLGSSPPVVARSGRKSKALDSLPASGLLKTCFSPREELEENNCLSCLFPHLVITVVTQTRGDRYSLLSSDVNEWKGRTTTKKKRTKYRQQNQEREDKEKRREEYTLLRATGRKRGSLESKENTAQLHPLYQENGRREVEEKRKRSRREAVSLSPPPVQSQCCSCCLLPAAVSLWVFEQSFLTASSSLSLVSLLGSLIALFEAHLSIKGVETGKERGGFSGSCPPLSFLLVFLALLFSVPHFSLLLLLLCHL